MNEVGKELDARYLVCPLPILKTKKALKDIPVGAILKVLATDPNTSVDMRAFADARGHELVSEEEAGGVLTFYLRRGS